MQTNIPRPRPTIRKRGVVLFFKPFLNWQSDNYIISVNSALRHVVQIPEVRYRYRQSDIDIGALIQILEVRYILKVGCRNRRLDIDIRRRIQISDICYRDVDSQQISDQTSDVSSHSAMMSDFHVVVPRPHPPRSWHCTLSIQPSYLTNQLSYNDISISYSDNYTIARLDCAEWTMCYI